MARSAKAGSAGLLQWIGLALIILIADQFTKVLIVGYYNLHDSTYVTSFFNVVRMHNTGAAFSFLAGGSGWQRWFFTAIGLAAVAFILWMLKSHAGQRLFSFALACEQITGAPLDHLVGIAGRQRMLSQRMAKFYFYRTWGLFDAPADMELHLSRAHFTAVLIQIEGSQHATAPVKAGVTAVRREWEPYQQALFANKEPAKMRRDAARVAELSERVLVVTEDLVARLVAQAQGALTTARA